MRGFWCAVGETREAGFGEVGFGFVVEVMKLSSVFADEEANPPQPDAAALGDLAGEG